MRALGLHLRAAATRHQIATDAGNPSFEIAQMDFAMMVWLYAAALVARSKRDIVIQIIIAAALAALPSAHGIAAHRAAAALVPAAA